MFIPEMVFYTDNTRTKSEYRDSVPRCGTAFVILLVSGNASKLPYKFSRNFPPEIISDMIDFIIV